MTIKSLKVRYTDQYSVEYVICWREKGYVKPKNTVCPSPRFPVTPNVKSWLLKLKAEKEDSTIKMIKREEPFQFGHQNKKTKQKKNRANQRKIQHHEEPIKKSHAKDLQRGKKTMTKCGHGRSRRGEADPAQYKIGQQPRKINFVKLLMWIFSWPFTRMKKRINFEFFSV